MDAAAPKIDPIVVEIDGLITKLGTFIDGFKSKESTETRGKLSFNFGKPLSKEAANRLTEALGTMLQIKLNRRESDKGSGLGTNEAVRFVLELAAPKNGGDAYIDANIATFDAFKKKLTNAKEYLPAVATPPSEKKDLSTGRWAALGYGGGSSFYPENKRPALSVARGGRTSRKLGNKFNRCVKSVRSTVRARKGSNKESAAIAICTTSVLHPRGRTIKRYRKKRLVTQRKFRGGGPECS
jgi:hypothetical protein